MKTMKKSLLVVTLLLTTFLSFGNTEKKVKTTIKVAFTDVKKGNTLTITNKDGVVLYKETIAKEGSLTNTFDFSKLEDGIYFVEVEKDFEFITKTYVVENNIVMFKEGSTAKIFKPYIRTDEHKVLLSKLTFDNKPVQVSLYFNSEKIYSETLNEDKMINRVYSLDKNEKGTYRVIVHNNGKSYEKEFNI